MNIDVKFDIGHSKRSRDDDCVVVCSFVVERALTIMMAWCFDGETTLSYW